MHVFILIYIHTKYITQQLLQMEFCNANTGHRHKLFVSNGLIGPLAWLGSSVI